MTKTELVLGIGIASTDLTVLLLVRMHEFETFGLEKQWNTLSRAEWDILVGAWKSWYELWGLAQEGERKQNISKSLRDHSYDILASSLLNQGLLLGPEAYWTGWACQPMSSGDPLISTFPDVELQVQLTIAHVFLCLIVCFPMVSEDLSGSCTRELLFWEETFSVCIHPVKGCVPNCRRMQLYIMIGTRWHLGSSGHFLPPGPISSVPLAWIFPYLLISIYTHFYSHNLLLYSQLHAWCSYQHHG